MAGKNGFANVDEVFGPFLAANDGFANFEEVVRAPHGSDERFCEEISSPKFAKPSFDATQTPRDLQLFRKNVLDRHFRRQNKESFRKGGFPRHGKMTEFEDFAP